MNSLPLMFLTTYLMMSSPNAFVLGRSDGTTSLPSPGVRPLHTLFHSVSSFLFYPAWTVPKCFVLEFLSLFSASHSLLYENIPLQINARDLRHNGALETGMELGLLLMCGDWDKNTIHAPLSFLNRMSLAPFAADT